jgi:hypothetical protein
MPILVGAGVGALSSALKGENILTGAALGGALGGVGGGVGSLLKGGSFAQGAGLSGLGSATGATAGKVATDLSTGQILSSAVPNTTGVNAFLEVPNVVSSGMSSLPTAGVGAFTEAPSMFDKLSKYATVDNLIGAGNVMSKFQPTPRASAPQGRITQGQAPQGGLGQGGVEGLLAELQKRQQQQYQPITLL